MLADVFEWTGSNLKKEAYFLIFQEGIFIFYVRKLFITNMIKIQSEKVTISPLHLREDIILIS